MSEDFSPLTGPQIAELYATAKESYQGSSKGQEIRSILDPVAARISTIVAVGVGVPSRCTGKKHEPLTQIAMLETMREVIESAKAATNVSMGTNVYFSERDLRDETDIDFIRSLKGFEYVHYDRSKETNTMDPEYFAIAHGKEQYWVNSARDRMSAITEKIDSSTLLFLPCLPHRNILRLVFENNFLVMIANPIESLFRWIRICSLAIDEEQEQFEKQWDEEYLAYKELRDDYWRKQIGSGFMAYSRDKQENWEQGQGSMDDKALLDEIVGDIPTDFHPRPQGQKVEEFTAYLDELDRKRFAA